MAARCISFVGRIFGATATVAEMISITPGSFSKSDSTHQKHPPANTADARGAVACIALSPALAAEGESVGGSSHRPMGAKAAMMARKKALRGHLSYAISCKLVDARSSLTLRNSNSRHLSPLGGHQCMASQRRVYAIGGPILGCRVLESFIEHLLEWHQRQFHVCCQLYGNFATLIKFRKPIIFDCAALQHERFADHDSSIR